MGDEGGVVDDLWGVSGAAVSWDRGIGRDGEEGDI